MLCWTAVGSVGQGMVSFAGRAFFPSSRRCLSLRFGGSRKNVDACEWPVWTVGEKRWGRRRGCNGAMWFMYLFSEVYHMDHINFYVDKSVFCPFVAFHNGARPKDLS